MLDLSRYPRHIGNYKKVFGTVATSASITEVCKLDVRRNNGKTVLAESKAHSVPNGKREIDVSWLASAADTYKVSGDPKDYVLVDVPIVTVDIPNRNLQAFPYEEVSYFDPLYGTMVYKTFIGKPTHADHDNADPLKAKGLHFDSILQPVPAYGIWKIRVLTAWDRTKDPQLVKDILSGKRNGYSMGSMVGSFVCSNCGALETQHEKCSCLKMGKGSIISGNLVYQVCIEVVYFETSSVGDPADVTAVSDVMWE